MATRSTVSFSVVSSPTSSTSGRWRSAWSAQALSFPELHDISTRIGRHASHGSARGSSERVCSAAVLKLASDTSKGWAAAALAHLDEILLDHPHCEKKAAGGALTLLFQYPERASFQAPLAALAREELAHFETLLAVLAERGIAFRRQRPSAYAGRLR